MFRVGDIVGRKSYGCDVLFRIVSISSGSRPEAQLKGISKRLYATADLSDLEVVKMERVEVDTKNCSDSLQQSLVRLRKQKALNMEKNARWKKMDHQYGERLGTIVHLDGDEDYCALSQSFYEKLGVKAICTFVPEPKQKEMVPFVLKSYHPDVLVLTGHDGKSKSGAKWDDVALYHNSLFFAQAVSGARKLRPFRDDLLVVAGACQSHYQVIMGAGANFASSPGRVLIDIYDPCLVAGQMAQLSVREYMDPEIAVQATSMKQLGLGGLESQGKMRTIYPHEGV